MVTPKKKRSSSGALDFFACSEAILRVVLKAVLPGGEFGDIQDDGDGGGAALRLA